jgi:O-antigen ligase
MSERLSAVTLAAFVYLLLISGGVIPYVEGEVAKSVAKGAMLVTVLLIACFATVRRSVLPPIGLFVLVGLAFMGAGLYRSSDVSFALEKIDGAILCSAAVALSIDRGYARFGEQRFQAAFLLFAFLILVATILYKAKFGFFDRQTRFLLNGPIIYGWLMGFCALLALHLRSLQRRVVWSVLFAMFLAALLWTESKGSAFAFAVGLAAYILSSFRKNFRFLLALALLSGSVYFLFRSDFIVLFEESRFSAVARLLTGELGQADDGSIGIRSLLLDEALRNFWAHPVFGTGLGQFTFDGFVYPHNQHLEIFAELGFVAGFAHLLFVAAALMRANVLHRCLILLFAVGSAFSGDASYLRFLYAFCLLTFLPGGRDRLAKAPMRARPLYNRVMQPLSRGNSKLIHVPRALV